MEERKGETGKGSGVMKEYARGEAS